MLQFFKQFAELLQESLAYLELDEGLPPEEIHEVEIDRLKGMECIVCFPELGVQYFAYNWQGAHEKMANWQFLRG